MSEANESVVVARSHALHVRAVREDAREADFIASTDCIDSYGEIVEQVWDLKRFLSNPVILFAHDSRALPIGQATSVGVKDGALECTIRFASAEANPLAENVWQSVKEKVLRALSVGFVPRDMREEMRDGETVWVLSDNELHEISVVPIPANPEALAKMRARSRAEAAVKAASEGLVMDTLGRVIGHVAAKESAGVVDTTITNTDNAALPQKAPEIMDAAEKKALEDKLAANAAAIVERDATIAQRTVQVQTHEKTILTHEKALADERLKVAALEAQNATIITERDADRAELVTLRASVIKREVDALIGDKIEPHEADLFVELATKDRSLFEKMVAQRSPMKILGGTVLPTSPAPIDKALPESGGDGTGGDALALIALQASVAG